MMAPGKSCAESSPDPWGLATPFSAHRTFVRRRAKKLASFRRIYEAVYETSESPEISRGQRETAADSREGPRLIRALNKAIFV
jgi:hypothetical protein